MNTNIKESLDDLNGKLDNLIPGITYDKLKDHYSLFSSLNSLYRLSNKDEDKRFNRLLDKERLIGRVLDVAGEKLNEYIHLDKAKALSDPRSEILKTILVFEDKYGRDDLSIKDITKQDVSQVEKIYLLCDQASKITTRTLFKFKNNLIGAISEAAI